MNSKKFLSLIISGLLMMSFTLTGCGKKSVTLNAKDKTQYINTALKVANIKTLDVSKATDAYSSFIIQECMEALGREEIKNGKDVIVPAGAKNWNVSQDGKTWTFNLMNMKWTDGKDVTAQDYVYSILRTLDPATGSQYAYLLTGSGITGAAAYNAGKGPKDAVGVKAADDHTLKITLDQPCAYFEKLLSNKLFTPQRQDLIEKQGDKWGATADGWVYNGPFKIQTYNNGSKIVLIKNENYWDKKSVKLSKLVVSFVEDESARMNSLLNGSIDGGTVDTAEWKDKLSKTGKFNYQKTVMPYTNYYFFNQKDKYFKNLKIRKAFQEAFDQADYVKSVWDSLYAPAYSFVPTSIAIGNDIYRTKVGSDVLPKKPAGDPKALLVEGLKEIGEDADPSKMDVRDLEPGTDAITKKGGDYLINLYKKKLGVNLKVDYMQWAQYNDKITKGDYQFSGMAWAADYNDPKTFLDMWESNAGVVPIYWVNKDYDALIDDSASTMDQSKRFQDFVKAEKILLSDDAVIIPTAYQVSHSFMPKYVKGVQQVLFAPTGYEYKYAYTQGRTK
mgnify:CR=1 FL=1